jgi:hypothetical protein
MEVLAEGVVNRLSSGSRANFGLRRKPFPPCPKKPSFWHVLVRFVPERHEGAQFPSNRPYETRASGESPSSGPRGDRSWERHDEELIQAERGNPGLSVDHAATVVTRVATFCASHCAFPSSLPLRTAGSNPAPAPNLRAAETDRRVSC